MVNSGEFSFTNRHQMCAEEGRLTGGDIMKTASENETVTAGEYNDPNKED